MKCIHCNSDIPDGAGFCPNCGQPQQMQPQQGQPARNNNAPQQPYGQPHNPGQPQNQQQYSDQLYGTGPQPRNNNAPQQPYGTQPQYNTPPYNAQPPQNNTSNTKNPLIIGLLVGISIIILITAFAVVLLFFKLKSNKESDSQVSVNSPEVSQSAQTGDSSDVNDANGTATASEGKNGSTGAGEGSDGGSGADPKNNTTQPQLSEDEYMPAYVSTLESHKDGITKYSWQNGTVWNYETETLDPAYPATSIAFYDINGDGIKELFYISCDKDEFIGVLHVCTYDNGSVREIYTKDWDLQVASGTDYYIFATSDGRLCAYNSIGDESMDYTYFQFAWDGSGDMTEAETWNLTEGPNADYTSTNYDYTHNGSAVSEADYNAAVNDMKDKMTSMLLYNKSVSINLYDKFGSVDVCEMSYNAAIEYASAPLAYKSTYGETVSMPFSKTVGFGFSSGAGAWGTGIDLQPDGSFEGSYHDSDMGVTGDDYPNGSVYYCNFKGKFGKVTQVNDHTYKLELEYIVCENSNYDEHIEDGVKYIGSDPYGMEIGNIYYLYMPGTPTSELSEECISWIYGLDGKSSTEDYILYNEAGRYGFSGYSE